MNTAVLESEELSATLDESAPSLASGASYELADWHRERRAAALQRFQEIPSPTRKDEAWRFTSLKALDISSIVPPLTVSSQVGEDLLARSRGLGESAGRMVFANDRLIARDLYCEALKHQGVIWLPLETAAVQHSDLVRKHFLQQEALLGSRKFAARSIARRCCA